MTVPTDQLTLRFARSMNEADQAAWDALAEPLDTPFFEWAWLKLLEDSGSAAPAKGWYPNHLLAQAEGRLVGALPLYLKWHSDGEFVFDQLWGEAASRLGLPYYPRLVSASPFTPATGLRFLTDPTVNQVRLSRRLFETIEQYCLGNGIQGAALLFAEPDFAAASEDYGFTAWRHQGYLWRNRDFATFDDFLGTLNANRRKAIRHERQALAAAGVTVEIVSGADIPDSFFPVMRELYDRTNAKFGPWGCRYLTGEFFEGLPAAFRHRLAFAAAFTPGRRQPVGLAMLAHKRDILFGRYWGAFEDIPFLHFELCYYAPIAWAIGRGIRRYDPGMGGAHKARRGFVSVSSYSSHRFFDPRMDMIFRTHIDRVNQLEKHYIDELNELLPVKRRG
ncbi:MAG: GNAT family N-acetyltransferase [Solidesulfovibrio sp.]|uniref:GNAT family N-acetyltransferase n=1 Tax=Solidesulfovibrio sp. TaxID=2910990 RepID=UPI002B1F04A7|nr:GNAT family N-acetyltransferase [Solidesulfovibrio sp.]MEA4856672.1 GNAT family N-acetyltransferase [Solidesulfovibrio sp.]